MYRLLYGKVENSNENVEQSTESKQETGAARLTNRPAIEATMNIASNAVKSAGGLTGKGSTYKILSKVLK